MAASRATEGVPKWRVLAGEAVWGGRHLGLLEQLRDSSSSAAPTKTVELLFVVFDRTPRQGPVLCRR